MKRKYSVMLFAEIICTSYFLWQAINGDKTYINTLIIVIGFTGIVLNSVGIMRKNKE